MTYSFRAKVWKVKQSGGWTFITLPKTISREIRKAYILSEEGWGRLKVCATVGETSWETAIWFDTKHQSYLLPLKKDIRKKENIVVDDRLPFSILLDEDED